MIQDQHGIGIEVASDQSLKPLDDELRVLLFHGVRELLANVVKQARASRVGISIKREGPKMRVRVEGEGVGLGISADTPSGRPNGLGLFSIRERLSYLGGQLEVDEAGVTLVVPLKY